MQPVLHLPDAIVTLEGDGPAVAVDESFETLLEQVVAPQSELSSSNLCLANPVEPGGARSLTCDVEDVVAATPLTEEDLLDPEQFTAVSECVSALASRNDLVSLSVTRANQDFEWQIITSRSILHTSLANGAVASLQLGNLAPPGANPCGPFPGVSADLSDASIDILDPGEADVIRSIPLPGPVLDSSIDELSLIHI